MSRLARVLVMASLAALLSISGAHAQVVCPNQHIFVYQPGLTNNATGQETSTRIRSVVSDPACTNENRHGTAHVRTVGVANEPFVEFGWYRSLNQTYVFYEIRRPDGFIDGPHSWPTSAPVNWLSRYRVQRIFGGTTWTFWRDWEADGTYDDQYPCAGCSVYTGGIWGGTPMGEAARVGATPAYDHHIDLFYRLTGPWIRWTDQD